METDRNFITALARGLDVLRAFGGREDGQSLSDIARIVDLPRATVRRCLLTFQTLGYISSNGREFYLTPKVLTLGAAYLTSTPLPRLLQPFLDRVSKQIGESCSAAILVDDAVVYIARTQTKRIMSVDLSVGSRLPAYCSALGRVMLAALPEDQLSDWLSRTRLVRQTERTITSKATFRNILKQVQHDGYSLVDQELELGLRGIAVPVHNTAGTVIAAINIGVQAARVGRAEMEKRFLPALRSAAEDARPLFAG